MKLRYEISQCVPRAMKKNEDKNIKEEVSPGEC